MRVSGWRWVLLGGMAVGGAVAWIGPWRTVGGGEVAVPGPPLAAETERGGVEVLEPVAARASERVAIAEAGLVEVAAPSRAEGRRVPARRALLGRIVGTVVSTAHGPVGRVPVVLRPEPVGDGRPDVARERRTGEAGRFAFDGVLPGTYRIAVELGSGRAAWTDETVGVLPAEDIVADVRAGDELDLTVRVEPAPAIGGRVVDRAGWPLGGRHVLANGASRVLRTVTRKDGAFRFGALLPGVWSLSVAEFAGGVGSSRAIEVVAGEEGVVLEVDQSLAIRASVHHPSGRRVTFRYVLRQLDGPRSGGVRGYVQGWATGELATRPLAPGTYLLVVDADGLRAERVVEVDPLAPAPWIAIPLEAPAELGVRTTLDDAVAFRVVRGGHVLALARLRSTLDRVRLSAGPAHVELLGNEGAVLAARPVFLAPDEELTLDLP